MKLFIATPSRDGQAAMGYAESLFSMRGELDLRGIESHLETVWNEADVCKGRNYLVHVFLKSDCTHLLWIDSDMAWTKDQALKLIESGKEIIGGAGARKLVNWKRMERMAGKPWTMLRHAACDVVISPVAKTCDNVRLDEPFEVRGVGCGFTLVAREVFEKLEAAGIEKVKVMTPNQGAFESVAWFYDHGRNEEGVFMPEDYSFCARSREAGFKVWIAPWMNLRHIGTGVYEGCVFCSNGSFIHDIREAKK